MSGRAFGFHRGSYGSFRIHHLVIFASALDIGSAVCAIAFFKSDIMSSARLRIAVKHFCSDSDRGIPFETHCIVSTSDLHFVAYARAFLPKRILNAGLSQSVGKISHCLVIVEIRLTNPSFGLFACHDKHVISGIVFFALDFKIESESLIASFSSSAGNGRSNKHAAVFGFFPLLLQFLADFFD